MQVKLIEVIEAIKMGSECLVCYYNKKTEEIMMHRDPTGLGIDDEEELKGELEENGGQYICLPTRDQIDEYDMMEDFVWKLPAGKNQELLGRAIQDRGAFRKFKDTLCDVGLEKNWFQYREKVYQDVAIKWCEENGMEYISPCLSEEDSAPEITITTVEDKEEKAKIVQEVLLDLPEWFGLPESTREYMEDSKELPLWVAKEENQILGFVTLTNSSEDCGDLHCMGVKKAYHRQGIGSLLYEELERFAARSYEYLQVKTVDEGHYKSYDQTIRFYKKQGFKKLEVFPTLWDEWNPCLILIKKIGWNSKP